MRYRVGVDSGGTFTDLVAIDEEGGLWIHKVASDRSAPARALLDGLAGIATKIGIEFESFVAQCDAIIHGTTVAINTLIQQNGAKTALLTTEGHEDSIEIRLGHKEDGHRYDFSFPPATPLVPAYLRLSVRERVLADGTVYTPLDEQHLLDSLELLKEQNVEAIAVSCLWSFLHPEHELRIGELVKRTCPDCFVSLSTRVLPQVGEYTRTSTTVTNAYIGPVLQPYMEGIERALIERGFAGTVYYMQSNGGVGTGSILSGTPVAALNSGPAAGPVAALHFGRMIDRENVVSVDMGGTSFDVCLVKEGLPDVVTDVDVARYRVGLPMVNVTSIGAGGGSIARVNERGVLQVGPESAEAFPGPACYARGGEKPTVTDALVVLGYLSSDALLGGTMPIDTELARNAIRAEIAEPLGITVDDAAQGIFELTANNMAEGIRIATIERGYDPRDFVLVAGGGAGPTFAGLLAHQLGVSTVVVPRVAGGLCAFGEAVADIRYDAVRSYPIRLTDIDCDRLNSLFAEMEDEGRHALDASSHRGLPVQIVRVAQMKYVDQVHYCDVPVSGGELDSEQIIALRRSFDLRHEQLYTYCEPDNDVQLLSLRTHVIISSVIPSLRTRDRVAGSSKGQSERSILLLAAGKRIGVPIFPAESVEAGVKILGPAIIEEETSTITVFPESVATLDARGFYILEIPDAA